MNNSAFQKESDPTITPKRPAIGTAYLVGAGPGDPGLLTVRACEVISQADVILYDRLIPSEALDYAREDAELVYVGKQGGGPSVSQSETNSLLLRYPLEGKSVVRLKGGDSFVFGRGGEEALALKEAGIPFEVIPGITAGLAATAYAGIPVTHREMSSSVAFVTGHEDPTKPNQAVDWDALAQFPGTLVFYMGVRALDGIASRLIAAGREPNEPAAVIERGTLPHQRTVTGKLHEIADIAKRSEIRPPAITVIGPVTSFATQLGWAQARPLHGYTVAVTRARAQASTFSARLRNLGAAVVETPMIRTVPLPAKLPNFNHYDLICLTSPNGVDQLFARLTESRLDARCLAACKIAAIGPGTATQLEQHGIYADLIPKRAVAEGLVETLEGTELNNVLIVRGSNGRDVLPDALRARGVNVEFLILYETIAEKPEADTLLRAAEADFITFTSGSTARFFIEAAGTEVLQNPTVVSIGPATTSVLNDYGVTADTEATEHTLDGLIDTLVGLTQSATSKSRSGHSNRDSSKSA